MAPLARRYGLAVLLSLGSTATWVCSQSGPGLPNLLYPPGEVFSIISTLGPGFHGKPMMHDGYLTVPRTMPEAGVDFYDISNPYAPRLVHTLRGIGMDLPEQHTYAQTTAWGGQHVVFARGYGPRAAGGGTGLALWDWSDIFNPRLESSFDLPGVSGGYRTGLFWLALQTPYIYCPAGSLGLLVVDASDPRNPTVVNQIPTSRTGGFNAVLAFAIGNTLIVTNNDAGTGVGRGFAKLDISDPTSPQLLYSSTSTSSPYGASVNGGRLIVPDASGSFRVHRLDDPTFPLVNELNFPGTRGASAVVQDGYAHVGASTAYYKVDISDPTQFTFVGGASTLVLIRDEDWVTPIGNLVAVADDAGNGTHLVPHRVQADNIGPSVNMVVPADGAIHQALTSRVGITMTDMVEMASIDENTFSVRRVGGSPLNGSYSHQFGIVNFAPAEPLQPNTSYEIVVAAGGMRDWAGNAVPETFVSRFSTGPQVTAIQVTVQPSRPVTLGQPSAFQVASVAGPGPFQYSWNFGDGTPSTPFSSSGQAAHTYTATGHYSALVTVTNGTITATDSFIQTVHYPLTEPRPTRASTIVIDESKGRVWCVNADNDTVTAIDMQTLGVVLEVPVGPHPRTLALAPDGSVWVVCQGDATVRVLDSVTGGHLATIEMPYASAPFGVAMSPNGRAAYVTLRATGRMATLAPATRALIGTTHVGPEPVWIAVASDSRVFVPRFISSPRIGDSRALRGDRGPVAQVYQLFGDERSIPLALDPGPDTEATGRGLPNYLSASAISPDGRRLWVPSKKDNIERGAFLSGEPLTFESTVRTIVSQVDLVRNREDFGARLDFNDSDMASAIAFSPLGDYAFCALQGSNAVEVRDAYTGAPVAGVDGTGLAPQGLALTGDGATLYVHNFMSRTVSAYDTRGVVASSSFAMPELGRVSTVANERLTPQVLRGKQIFYNAADRRMSQDGYISCASCHLDGEQDGRTWDFTDRGEGLRNTISLIGRAGTAQGNVHWTGNFDEIQDFENDIRDSFRGRGFMDDQLFQSGTVRLPLGQAKAGLSADLDALAAYVSSLTAVGLSPYRRPDGTLTPGAQQGRAIFARLQCASCHSGRDFTDSAQGIIHDVGTIQPSSGQASGSPLLGLDTPTLRGLWASAPYLHDGSAPTLMDVLTVVNPAGLHGNTAALTPQEQRQLAAYLRQIDDLEPAAQ